MSLKDLQTYLSKKQLELRKIKELDLLSIQLNFRQAAFLRYALENPRDTYTTIKTHQSIYGVVHQTARKDLISLVKLGFVIKRKMGNEFYFYPIPDLYEKISNHKLNKK